MIARAWDDPDAEPDVVALVIERMGASASQAELERLAHRACDAHDIEPGPLDRRLALLRQAGEARGEGPLSAVAKDLLDSLMGCALNVRQLCEDTGMERSTVTHALDSLRMRGLVSRERLYGVWTYRTTALGRRALQAGRTL